MKKIDISDFLFHALFPIIVGSSIGFMLKDYNSYIEGLEKSIKVPSIVFPIVWSILYLLIGVWYHFFEIEASKTDKIIYYFGLLLNFMFSPVLFYFENSLYFTKIIMILFSSIMFIKLKSEKIEYVLNIVLSAGYNKKQNYFHASNAVAR